MFVFLGGVTAKRFPFFIPVAILEMVASVSFPACKFAEH